MKNIVILFYVLLTFSSCAHKNQHTPLIMDSNLKEFSDRWKADSLGVDSFRISQLFFDKKTKNWIVGGYGFSNYSKEDFFEVLGKPNECGYHFEGGYLMVYTLKKNKIKQLDKSLIVYFDKNEKFDGFVLDN